MVLTGSMIRVLNPQWKLRREREPGWGEDCRFVSRVEQYSGSMSDSNQCKMVKGSMVDQVR